MFALKEFGVFDVYFENKSSIKKAQFINILERLVKFSSIRIHSYNYSGGKESLSNELIHSVDTNITVMYQCIINDDSLQLLIA